MESCENCIHIDICRDIATHYNQVFFEDGKCELFKASSTNIDLPCDVGDFLYVINGKGEIKSWKILCIKTTKSLLRHNPEHIEITIGCDKGASRGILWFNLDKIKNVYFNFDEANEAKEALEKRKYK